MSALTTELGVGLKAVNVQSLTSNLDAYDLYLKAREMFIARENLPTSWQLLERATHMDPGFARAWEALAAAHRSLEINPSLSMAHAVIGMQFEKTGVGYAGAIRDLGKAIDNDPKNATAWLWREITLKDMGYIQRSMGDFEQCLAIDSGYLNCRQYLAETLLTMGRIEEAIREYESTLEANFHSTSDAFVSYYVHTGQRTMALTVAALGLRNQFAPIKDWIEAIENPDEDHSSRVARFNLWGRGYNIDVCSMGTVSIALRQPQCFTSIDDARLMWQPDSACFRKTPEFKDFVNEHLMAYWQEKGLPPQCHTLNEGDFECD